jgi:hypothetical protein
MPGVSSIPSSSSYYTNYSPYAPTIPDDAVGTRGMSGQACYPEEELVSLDSNVSINFDQPALEDREPPPSVGEGMLGGAFASTSLACGAKTGLWVEDMWVEDPVDGGSDTGTDAPRDVSDDAYDYYDASDDSVNADGDSMPDEVPPSDVHEVGDESIADASEDASDYYDTSEAEETCERTCEPGPCSSILNVPGDYPTVEEAMGVARWGDIIQLAPGTHFVEASLIMTDCTHIRGDESGPGTTSEIEAENPGESCVVIIGAEGSSIDNVAIRPPWYSPGIGIPDYLCSTILIDNVSMDLEAVNVAKLDIRGDAAPQISRGIFTWLALYDDNASGELNGGSVVQSLILRGNSHPRVRNIRFHPAAGYGSPDRNHGVAITENANPDLGTGTDYGNNIFNNDNIHPEHSCLNLVYAYSISNQTPNVISAVGNQFEQEYELGGSCGIYYGTYQDMLAHPDPYDPASDILTIEDNHDNPAYGIVDYSGFIAGLTP